LTEFLPANKWWSKSIRVTRQPQDAPLSFFRPLSLRRKSPKLPKVTLAEVVALTVSRRQSSAGDQQSADPPVHPGRQKFRARRSLSVIPASVRADQGGERSISSRGRCYKTPFRPKTFSMMVVILKF
jgi:hypothetical protein